MNAERLSAARIEGGYDAIVLGGGPESLVAAAYLGRAGFATLLLEPDVEVGAITLDRTFAEEFDAPSYEHLLYGLDPRVVRELALYRHGLAFAARRLDTTYMIGERERFSLNGDLWRTKDALVERFPDEAGAAERFFKSAISLSENARNLFSGDWAGDLSSGYGALPETLQRLAEARGGGLGRRALSSVEEVAEAQFSAPELRAAVGAEAVFRYDCEPADDFSFLGLAVRLGGESSGLRAAIAYPEHGMTGLAQALRRSAQAAGVEFRTGVQLSRILIEWDGAAGVELQGGGQIRCPIVVSGLDPVKTFLDLIGPAELDIELQREATGRAPMLGAAKANVAVSADAAIAGEAAIRLGAPARFVLAGEAADIGRAYAAARRGAAPEKPIIEAVVLPTPVEDDRILANGVVISALVHPTPAEPRPDVRRKVAADVVERLAALGFDAKTDVISSETLFAGDLAKRAGVHIGSFAAEPPVLEQLLRSRVYGSMMNYAGFQFCGHGAGVGTGVSGASGRRAAKAAVRDFRRRRKAA
ncbi:MAG: hypothetical protein AAFV51_08695 [Pseudomonadota bacterium]